LVLAAQVRQIFLSALTGVVLRLALLLLLVAVAAVDQTMRVLPAALAAGAALVTRR
jgi:hypothetical protein